MALRVLLADESSTIKKVMQLALSDFAVEVKSVPVGVDVLSVAKSFNPDLVFADVLLSKKNGYEVCHDLKNSPETKNIPVILMWSGFMEIDEAKAIECKADSRLEKPFDADILRSIVKEFVEKTNFNPVSDFLTFPEMPEFEEVPAVAKPKAIPTPIIAEESDEGGWAHQDLSKFKIQLPPEEIDSNNFASKFVIPQDDDVIAQAEIEEAGDFEEITFAKPSASAANSLVSKVEKSVKEQMMQTLQKGRSKAADAEPNIQSKVDLNTNMIEKVVREEAREVIESVCWKILPEIAERVVREELNKILKDTEKSI